MNDHRTSPWLWPIFITSLLSGLLVAENPAGVQHTSAPAQPPAASQLAAWSQPGRPHLEASHGALPLSFEPNEGQVDRQVKFLSRGRGYALFLTSSSEAVLSLKRPGRASADPSSRTSPPPEAGRAVTATRPDREPGMTGAVVRMRLVGSKAAQPVGLASLPGKSSYFIGNDPKKWHTNVPHYAKVKYEAVYPGVDLVYYGNQQQLEYDFVIAPGADPGQIKLEVQADGVRQRGPGHPSPLRLATSGDLVVQTEDAEVRFHKPVMYQPGSDVKVEGHYVLTGTGEVGFEVASYDRSKPLVIDPVLSYSTYVGGSADDSGSGIALDAARNIYVTGETCSSDFPTANAVQPARARGCDAFVTKINALGSAVVYSTYLGGNDTDRGNGIAVDSAGNAYVVGTTFSTDFPVANALQDSFGGGFGDAFVAKLSPSGAALAYSTYLGGNAYEDGFRIAVDRAGHAYVAGATASPNFPAVGALQPTRGGDLDAFVTKFSPSGSALVYSTYLGGSHHEWGFSIAVDAAGSAYVVGRTDSPDFPTVNPLQPTNASPEDFIGDAFVAKVNASGTALVYSTYLGGSGAEGAVGVAVDAAGNAYITGWTTSTDFPTLNPIQPSFGFGRDGFVTKLNASGSAMMYSTYLGGSGYWDFPNDIAVDAAGDAHVTGTTESIDFPTANPVQRSFAGGACTVAGGDCGDAFVAKLNPSGSALLYSTFLGGSGEDGGRGIALDTTGSAYVVGGTTSVDFPAVHPIHTSQGGRDVFVAKISEVTPINFAGTPGQRNCHGKSVSALARQFGGLDAAASALHLAGVPALQNAIRAFCAE